MQRDYLVNVCGHPFEDIQDLVQNISRLEEKVSSYQANYGVDVYECMKTAKEATVTDYEQALSPEVLAQTQAARAFFGDAHIANLLTKGCNLQRLRKSMEDDKAEIGQ